jgi:hypothetical protein
VPGRLPRRARAPGSGGGEAPPRAAWRRRPAARALRARQASAGPRPLGRAAPAQSHSAPGPTDPRARTRRVPLLQLEPRRAPDAHARDPQCPQVRPRPARTRTLRGSRAPRPRPGQCPPSRPRRMPSQPAWARPVTEAATASADRRSPADRRSGVHRSTRMARTDRPFRSGPPCRPPSLRRLKLRASHRSSPGGGASRCSRRESGSRWSSRRSEPCPRRRRHPPPGRRRSCPSVRRCRGLDAGRRRTGASSRTKKAAAAGRRRARSRRRLPKRAARARTGSTQQQVAARELLLVVRIEN